MATSVQGRFSATREAAPSRTPSIWRVAVLQRWLIVISGAFVLLRIPSFIEPPWYSDAGTYADIGWALNHGARLYVDVWDNKPPGIHAVHRRRGRVRGEHREKGGRRWSGNDRGPVLRRRCVAAKSRRGPVQRRALRRDLRRGRDRDRGAFLEAQMVDRRRGAGRPGSALQRGLRGGPGCRDGNRGDRCESAGPSHDCEFRRGAGGLGDRRRG